MSKGQAKIAISQGLSVWVLEAPQGFGDADFHAHHAIQITAGLTGPLEISLEHETLTGSVLAVAADARHRFRASGLLVFIFVEPESGPGRALTANLLRGRELSPVASADILEILAPLTITFEQALGSDDLLRAGRAVVELMMPHDEAPMPDARIRRVIEHASRHIEGALSLSDMAHHLALSPSRLRHLFVEQTGLAFKTYILWLRLVRAIDIYSKGQSLTEAAHGAGFSDSAHFSRVFRRTFGLPATTLKRIVPN
jgi:AraC-like DNA-binding protein